MLLLDSQVVLWALTDSPRLGASARKRIAESTQVHVSSATVLELTIKSMLGKLQLPEGFVATLKADGYRELPITHADAEGLAGLPELAQHDPFDRILVSQASRAKLTLLTADRVLLQLGRADVVDASM